MKPLPSGRKVTDYIYTYTGKVLYPEEIKASDISIRDIAHALAGINRYNGHSRISVLRHSMAVYEIAKATMPTRKGVHLYALIHDAQEAYVMDVPVPMKRFMKKEWQGLEIDVQYTIRAHLGVFISLECEGAVHEIDKGVVEFEMNNSQGGALANYQDPHLNLSFPAESYLREEDLPMLERSYQWHYPESHLVEEYCLLVPKLARGLLGQ
jgi:hypothetical protein